MKALAVVAATLLAGSAMGCGSGAKNSSSVEPPSPTAASVATVTWTVVPSTAIATIAPLEPLATTQESGDIPADQLTVGLLWNFQPMLLTYQMVFGGEEGEGMGSGLQTLDKLISDEETPS